MSQLEDLEDYALNSDVDESDINDSINRLCRPYNSHKSDVSAEELANLDAEIKLRFHVCDLLFA